MNVILGSHYLIFKMLTLVFSGINQKNELFLYFVSL